VAGGAAPVTERDLSLEPAEATDVGPERWFPTPPSWLEIAAIAFFVTVLVDAVVVGAIALAIVAFATWGPS
jgi:hypothetical protein